MQNIPVLYEDGGILAISKPSGVLVHGTGLSKEETIADWFLGLFPNAREVGEPLFASGGTIARPGIVHRLDRETSGVLLLAKNQKAHAHLKKQFQAREVLKKYLAVVYGKVDRDFGSINSPLGRSRGDFRQYATPKKARGEMRDALTYFSVKGRTPGATLLEVIPKTGRTHQIRAHLASIGHPIVSDRVYAKDRLPMFGLTRTALHARSITFKDLNGKEVIVEAPLPGDFEAAVTNFKGVSI